MNRILFCHLKPITTTYQFVNKLIPQCKYTTYGIYKPAFTFKPIQYSIQLLQNYTKRTYLTQAPLDIDVSKLTKDVIIFKYVNDRYFKWFNIFGIIQFFILMICAEANKNTLQDIPVDKTIEGYDTLPFYQKVNLGEDKYRYGISLLCCGLGIAILCFVWMYTLQTVKYLILRKGGKTVSIVTYRPLGNNGILNVPLHCIKALEFRQNAGIILPFKVKNKFFWYMLDTRGNFTNKELFDHVVNVRRRF